MLERRDDVVVPRQQPAADARAPVNRLPHPQPRQQWIRITHELRCHQRGVEGLPLGTAQLPLRSYEITVAYGRSVGAIVNAPVMS